MSPLYLRLIWSLGPVMCKLHAEYPIVMQAHKTKSRELRIKEPVALVGMGWIVGFGEIALSSQSN